MTTTPLPMLDPATPSVDGLLRSAVWDDTAARRVVAGLPAEVVHGPERTTVLHALAALVEEGVTVDPATVAARIVDQQKPGWDDAMRWLPDLVTGPPLAGTLGWHLDRLTEQAARVRVLALSASMAQAADQDDLHGALQEVRDRLDRVSLGAATAPPTLADLTDTYLRRLETGDTTQSIPTGLLDLDHLLGGFRAGQLIVVGARPGVGKSNLLGDFTRAATRTGRRVLLHSLEMPRDEVWARHTAAVAHVSLSNLINNEVTEEDWSRIARAQAVIRDESLFVEDRPSLTVGDIARHAQAAHPDLLLIDYLQLLQPAKPSGNRQEDVAAMSRALKLLARELRCPVIVAAQLNRGQTNRADTAPRMSDLRESGAIEADADVVILLDRDDQDETQGTTARLIVAKNRNGPTGTVDLAFLGSYASFGQLARWEAT